MKEGKKALGIQTSSEILDMLREICEHEGRSQAKQIEVWIKKEYKLLKLDKK